MGLAHSPRIVTDGLVLCLDAANRRSYPGAGTIWNDMSGNNNGTLTNGPTYSGANGGSIVFDGTNDYVLMNKPNTIVTGGAITICLWAKWITTGTTTSTIQALVDNNHTFGPPSQGFIIQDRPDLSKQLTFSSNPNIGGVTSTFQVGDGTWRHIVATNDTITSKLYINGALNNSLSQGGLATVQPKISIGYWQNLSGRYLNGNVANLQIYDRALTSQEVLQNYNATKRRFL